MAEVTKPVILDETGQSIVASLGQIKTAIENSGGGGGGSTVDLDDVGTASSTTCRYQRLTIGSNSYEIRGTKYMEQNVTVSASLNTSVTFTSEEITSDTVVDVYTSIYDITAATVNVSSGVCIVTFNPHTATTFICKIYLK